MNLETAARHTVDRNGRLHRPNGQFASNAERAAWWKAGEEALEARIMAEFLRSVRAFLAPEVRPARPVTGRRPKGVNYFGFAAPTFA